MGETNDDGLDPAVVTTVAHRMKTLPEEFEDAAKDYIKAIGGRHRLPELRAAVEAVNDARRRG